MIQLPYYRKYKVSEKRRKKYYIEGKHEPTAKKFEDDRYFYGDDGFLYDSKDVDKKGRPQRVVANPLAAGTPRFQRISGQAFYDGSMNEHVRTKIVKSIKSEYVKIMRKEPGIPADKFPLRIWIYLSAHPNNWNWDMDNLWIHSKMILDSLVEAKLIPDDSIKFVSASPYMIYRPIKESEEEHFLVRLIPKDEVVTDYAPYYNSKAYEREISGSRK